MQEARVISISAEAPAQYPMYRKYKSGVEWQKIASPNAVIHITNTGTWWNMSFDTAAADVITQIMEDPEAKPCTRDEFEKIYGNAHWVLTQINGIHSHNKLPAIQEDDPICMTCGGSGEGLGPGACCSSCNGNGHQKSK